MDSYKGGGLGCVKGICCVLKSSRRKSAYPSVCAPFGSSRLNKVFIRAHEGCIAALVVSYTGLIAHIGAFSGLYRVLFWLHKGFKPETDTSTLSFLCQAGVGAEALNPKPKTRSGPPIDVEPK